MKLKEQSKFLKDMFNFISEWITPSGFEPKCHTCYPGSWPNHRDDIIVTCMYLHKKLSWAENFSQSPAKFYN